MYTIISCGLGGRLIPWPEAYTSATGRAMTALQRPLSDLTSPHLMDFGLQYGFHICTTRSGHEVSTNRDDIVAPCTQDAGSDYIP